MCVFCGEAASRKLAQGLELSPSGRFFNRPNLNKLLLLDRVCETGVMALLVKDYPSNPTGLLEHRHAHPRNIGQFMRKPLPSGINQKSALDHKGVRDHDLLWISERTKSLIGAHIAYRRA